MKNFFILLCILSLAYSCSRVKDKKNITSDTTLTADQSTVTALADDDINHYVQAIEKFVDSNFGRSRFNGSILVARNGTIIFEKYSGFRDPRVTKDSITPSTPFHLASISKTFTGMAILKLWEEGKLNIDDSVSKYLAGFPCTGVTIRTLLNHRSGIPNYGYFLEKLKWDKKVPVTNQQILDFIIQRHDEIQIGTPDRGFSYSNTNYALLALVIEKVSGLFYGDFLKLNFFDPLQMKDSYVWTLADSSRALPSFFYSGRQYAFDFLDLVYGDKNIYSTVRDLHKWDQALHNGKLFKNETLQAAYTPYSNEKPGVNNYGLGWRMFVLKNGKKFIYHNGWWHGNRTAFYRLLDENATIIALCNNDFKRVYSSKKIADIFGNYFQRHDEDTEMEDPSVRSKFRATDNALSKAGGKNDYPSRQQQKSR